MSIEPTRKPEPFRIPAFAAAVLGIAAPALVTPLALAIFGREDLPNVAILYLFVIAVVSLRLGYRPSLLAAVTSALCLDYFFTLPYHSLAISQGRELMTLAGLLGTAIFVSTLTERMRKDARAARRSERRNEQQAALVWTLAEAESLEELCARAAQQVALAADTEVRILLRGGDGRLWVARGPEGTSVLALEETAAVEWAASSPRGIGGRGRRRFGAPRRRTCPCARRAGASVWWRSAGGTEPSATPRRSPFR